MKILFDDVVSGANLENFAEVPLKTQNFRNFFCDFRFQCKQCLLKGGGLNQKLKSFGVKNVLFI